MVRLPSFFLTEQLALEISPGPFESFAELTCDRVQYGCAPPEPFYTLRLIPPMQSKQIIILRRTHRHQFQEREPIEKAFVEIVPTSQRTLCCFCITPCTKASLHNVNEVLDQSESATACGHVHTSLPQHCTGGFFTLCVENELANTMGEGVTGKRRKQRNETTVN